MRHSETPRSKSQAVLLLVLAEGAILGGIIFASVSLANGAGWLRHLF